MPSAANADDFIAGYFDKYVSDDSAARFLESMKWQRRFFVFSESQRVLYYFKSPEDVSKPQGLRGQVNIAGGYWAPWAPWHVGRSSGCRAATQHHVQPCGGPRMAYRYWRTAPTTQLHASCCAWGCAIKPVGLARTRYGRMVLACGSWRTPTSGPGPSCCGPDACVVYPLYISAPMRCSLIIVQSA